MTNGADVINFRRTPDAVEEPQKKSKRIGGEEHIFYRPEMHVSAEDQDTLGPLRWATTYSAHPTAILDGIYRCVTTQMMDDLKGSDHMARSKALCAICKAYEILCRAGYDEFLPLHRQLQIGFYRIAQTQRKVLTRRLLSPETSDEEAEQISQFLVDMAWKHNVGNA
jgi:hypothetical protein